MSEQTTSGSVESVTVENLYDKVVAAIKTVYDPEIPVKE